MVEHLIKRLRALDLQIADLSPGEWRKTANEALLEAAEKLEGIHNPLHNEADFAPTSSLKRPH